MTTKIAAEVKDYDQAVRSIDGSLKALGLDVIDLTRGMLVEAYSPIGHGELLNDERVAGMATRYGVTVPQLSIRYALQLGLLPLPKTGNPKHMEDNARVDFTIADSDMDALKELRS